MATGPRALTPSELYDIAAALAENAAPAGIEASEVRKRLDLPGSRFRPGLAPIADWQQTVEAVHAGVGKAAGYRADGVARLVDTLGLMLPANAALADLAYRLGADEPTAEARTNVRVVGEIGICCEDGWGGHTKTLAETAKAVVDLGVSRGGTRHAIFLSYASPDRAAVDRLYDTLAARAPGVELFQDYRCIALGRDWLTTIREAASSASVLTCWVTPRFLERTFCAYEIGIAEGRGVIIAPIWVDGLDPKAAPAYLSGRQGLAAKDPYDYEQVAGQLAAAL